MLTSYVDVAVNSGAPSRGAFSYSVPEGMELQPGDGVMVPFGRRSLQGIVVAAVETPAVAAPKQIEAKLDSRPVISAAHVALAAWISEYYLAPLFASVALMLPPGFERKPLTFYRSLVSAAEAARLPTPPRQRSVLSYVIEHGPLEGATILRDVRVPGVANALGQLAQRGLIERTYGLDRSSVRPKTARYVYLTVGRERAEAEAAALGSQRRRRAAAVLSLLCQTSPRLPASELRLRTGATLPILQSLTAAGLVIVRDEPVERDPLEGRAYEALPPPHLTPGQAAALAPLEAALDLHKGRTFLLHGVTGSGKTEVYLQALDLTLRQGRRGIVLVPEIALTPQTIRRFAERFPGQVAVLHSGLSPGELFDQWYGIRDGRYGVVVGSRSALFAPQPNLGLIVIDEEHEWTFKQSDQAPRYDAHETAEKLSELTGAISILGSATPDVTSYQRALWGRYSLLELRERVRPVLGPGGRVIGIESSSEMPPVEVVDMREELKSGNRSIFSRPLQLGLYQALERSEQTILFINRRGVAGYVQCRDCGYVPHCPACAIALGFHHVGGDGGGGRLLCHQCNRARRMYERCPMCGGRRLRPMGLGVEGVEEEVHQVFPKARTLRWDRDVTRGRNAHEKILAQFVQGEADVLIGTQMVAKGLDLPAVTLVGVISADIGLHVPDFRSGERTFQLLTQVSGRAGRALSAGGGPVPGRVVVQTYTPDNYAIIAAAAHDYASFFAAEIELRHEAAYPPFVRLARLLYSASNPEAARERATRLTKSLREEIEKRGIPGTEVIGPAPPLVPKWHGRSRWQITLRSPDPAELLRDFRLPADWTVDIDPVSLA